MIAQKFWNETHRRDLLDFYVAAVKTRSYSDQEGELAQKLLAKMKELGYDEAYVDAAGNVCGRVGRGGRVIHFDSHMDTVLAENADEWKHPPFTGEIEDGKTVAAVLKAKLLGL